jgi:predicted ABC-type ATPase
VIEPCLVLIGGANGAGKSTLAGTHIPDLIATGRFLNALSRRIFRREGRQIDISSAEEMKGLRLAVERAGGHPTF